MGATVHCVSSQCKRRVHFYCAYKNNYTFLSSKKVVCPACMLDVQAFCVDQLKYTMHETVAAASRSGPKRAC